MASKRRILARVAETISSQLCTSSDIMPCEPQSRQSRRATLRFGVIASVGRVGRFRAMRAAVVPLDVYATMAAAWNEF